MSKMLSASTLKHNFMRFLPLLVEHNAFIDIDYKGRVYRVHIEDLKKDAPRITFNKDKKQTRLALRFCRACGGLLFEGVCTTPEKH